MIRQASTALFASSLLLTSCSTTEREHTRIRADAAFGGGKLKHSTNGSALDDSATAAYFAFGAEVIGRQNLGGGVRFQTVTSDDDLFLGGGAGTPAQAFDSELFLHGTGVLGTEDNSFPIRFGLFFRNYTLEAQPTGNDINWSSFGPRVEVAPDITLATTNALRWSLTSVLGFGAGVTTIDTSPATQEWDTTMVQADLALGTRLQLESLRLDLGWMWRGSRYDESDVTASTTGLEADSTFSGFTFGLGATF